MARGPLVIMIRFLENSKLNANSVDPDQTPRSVASDLGLHCLPTSLLWSARLKLFRLLTVPRLFLCSGSPVHNDVCNRVVLSFSSLYLSVSQEGCASLVGHFLARLCYIFYCFVHTSFFPFKCHFNQIHENPHRLFFC